MIEIVSKKFVFNEREIKILIDALEGLDYACDIEREEASKIRGYLYSKAED